MALHQRGSVEFGPPLLHNNWSVLHIIHDRISIAVPDSVDSIMSFSRYSFLNKFLGLAMMAWIATTVLGETSTPNPLGVFNFDLSRVAKTPVQQAMALREIGFTGVTLNFNGKREAVEAEFEGFRKTGRSGDFQVYAAHLAYFIENDEKQNMEQVEWALGLLKSVNADLWLIVRSRDNKPVPRTRLLKNVEMVADLCAQRGVHCVLYPHDNTLIENAGEAVSIVKELRRDDIWISFHLCHEIRAGNGDRLEEVAQMIKPYIRLASISGSDNKYVDNSIDWSQNIQPLDMGSYDTSKFINALQSIGYRGAVILHTYGLQNAKPDHHLRSFKKYQQLFR